MFDGTVLDPDRCYLASQSRDERFDGWFYVAVRTTGIYCRPSCPAITPKRANVEFHRTAAAAQQLGFRACKRCRPDAAPGSPEWNVRGDVVARAMRLIGDGVVDRDGVAGLADRLGYSERHLNRLLTSELGAGPLSLARAQRAQTARTLIETTDLSMTDVAFAAGFGSIRQFNDTVREVYASSPTELRSRTRHRSGTAGGVSVRLPVRRPFAGGTLLAFVGGHAVPGVEAWDGERYARSLALPNGHGTVDITLDHVGDVRAEFRLTDWRDLAPAVGRVRRLLDLDADPVAIDEILGADPILRPQIERNPGLRVPGGVDPYEVLARTIIGQQVSVAGARTVTGRIVAAIGEPLAVEHDVLTHVFPTMDRLAAAPPDALPIPMARKRTLRSVAEAVADGDLVIDHGDDRRAVVDELCSYTGIGPWTAETVAMRGLGDPDVFLPGDLVVRRALEANGLDVAAADRWRPWRTYAMHHLWATVWTPPT
ncbi:DNA-3-methyladenine glycosylase II [Ilumatobacter fluminis]|uniref:DNA-3-methyladenine glycosylase II n=1 Tax=Ilumatobacter fluminis TaxID=467091 RepID=A0A4R7I3R8_9ACTN|nr:AlkA N-terminal domain-containing protein [Ilumatobacter fluminis]TDT17894.1 DNA-3-methyladenine glycosylase II [Ilumatobacter fluminis]